MSMITVRQMAVINRLCNELNLDRKKTVEGICRVNTPLHLSKRNASILIRKLRIRYVNKLKKQPFRAMFLKMLQVA